jgi:hypothetical protein
MAAPFTPLIHKVTTACTECRRARRKVALRPVFPLVYDTDFRYLVPSVHRASEMQKMLLQRPPMHHRARFGNVPALERLHDGPAAARRHYPGRRIWAGIRSRYAAR